MTIQQINIGSSPKGKGGDTWREGSEKINGNFQNLDERTTLAQETANSKTANATDAHLLSRSNHTGTQPISTISGLQAALDSAASQINITGNAATATSALHANEATHAVSSDTADSANHATTAGQATTAGKLGTPVQINGVDFDGSQSINIAVSGGSGSASYADTAGKLASPVQMHGVNFDGSTWINIPNFTATKSGVVPAAGSDTTKYLRSDGTWGIPTDTNTTYSTMTATDANTGTATTGQLITAAVLKDAIQTHAPTGTSGGMNFAAKVGLELEIVFDFVSGSYYTSSNILSVSNQTNIASAVIDSNGVLCLTFNTPISNPNLIVTTKGEVKNVTYNGMDYKYLTSNGSSSRLSGMLDAFLYNIIQDAEKGYVNTSTKLYISCNLSLWQDYDNNTNEVLSTYSLKSAFPAKFNIGIIDA